jgi:hypothetical protein
MRLNSTGRRPLQAYCRAAPKASISTPAVLQIHRIALAAIDEPDAFMAWMYKLHNQCLSKLRIWITEEVDHLDKPGPEN